MVVQEFKTRVISIWDAARNLKTFRVERPESLNFSSGNHCSVSIGREGLQKLFRPFSFASSPTEKGFLEFTIKRYSGITESFFKLSLGDTLNMKAPYSSGIEFDEAGKNFVFIAGGTGICPFMSAIRYVVAKNLDVRIVLFNSNQTQEDIFYREELEQIGRTCKNIKIINTLTRENPEKWVGETGRISREILQKYIPDLNRPAYYVCGPKIMVQEIKCLLQELGIQKQKIKP